MNGFRITLLTLLCLTVGLMFYAVLFVVPAWQDQYNSYQSTLRIAEYEKKSDIHRQQMLAYDPSVESPEVQQARLDQEAAARRGEAALNEAEETNVLAAAKRREENARAESEAAARKSAASPVIGLVASYDPEWQCIMVRPSVPEAFLPGAVLAIRRDKRILCEAIVDSRDAESGQVSATIKESDFSTRDEQIDSAKLTPAVGDEVMISPFPSANELRSGASPAQLPAESPAPVEPLPTAQQPEPPAQPEQTQPVEQPQQPQQQPEQPQPADASQDAPPPPTPVPNEVQKALDTIKPSTPSQPSETNKELPSLDALLHPTPF